MVFPTPTRAPRSLWPVGLILGAVGLVTAGVLSGGGGVVTSAFLVLVTVVAMARITYVSWPKMIAALILIILFIPIRRYALPGALPFQLEPYRIFVGVLVLAWIASLLADSTMRVRRNGFEGPLLVIVGGAFASVIANPGNVAPVSGEVQKALMFLLSYVVVLYVTTSVIRRLDHVDFLAKVLVGGGAVVAFSSIIEARTGFNVFNHLSAVMPFLRDTGELVGGYQRAGTSKLRVFGSAQHPIALGAVFVMLTPLAFYLARRYRQRRWLVCALMFAAACASTISRTGIVMFVVLGIVFLWLRPKEIRKLWPALLLTPVAIHFALPGTLGAIKQTFLPAGGLVAEQHASANTSGSGRLADVGPALQRWSERPTLGEGYGAQRVDLSAKGTDANIFDDQWLGTLVSSGIVGFFGWLWLFFRAVRRFGKEAKKDLSERGWLLASIAAGIAAYAIGMLTYDAFAFIQVTFLMFIFLGIGSALMEARPTPLAVREERARRQSLTPGPTVA
jgi:polysaccharide biosynthesis protein PslJ